MMQDVVIKEQCQSEETLTFSGFELSKYAPRLLLVNDYFAKEVQMQKYKAKHINNLVFKIASKPEFITVMF